MMNELFHETFDDDAEQRPRQGGIIKTFPKKLYDMLTEFDHTKHHQDIVSWGPDGKGFVILQPKAFTATLLPKVFRTSKFTSFQRQLNAYGFLRVNMYAAHDDMHVYQHEEFHRGHPERVSAIKRRKGVSQTEVLIMRRKKKQQLLPEPPQQQPRSISSSSIHHADPIVAPARSISMAHVDPDSLCQSSHYQHVGLLKRLCLEERQTSTLSEVTLKCSGEESPHNNLNQAANVILSASAASSNVAVSRWDNVSSQVSTTLPEKGDSTDIISDEDIAEVIHSHSSSTKSEVPCPDCLVNGHNKSYDLLSIEKWNIDEESLLSYDDIERF